MDNSVIKFFYPIVPAGYRSNRETFGPIVALYSAPVFSDKHPTRQLHTQLEMPRFAPLDTDSHANSTICYATYTHCPLPVSYTHLTLPTIYSV